MIPRPLAQLWQRYLYRRGVTAYSLLTPVLSLISIFVGIQVRRARRRAKKESAAPSGRAPVLSIGSISVGGSGKTPLTISLARAYLTRGMRIGIASNGYGRKSRESLCGSASEIGVHSAGDIGDEVKLICQSVPNAHVAVAPRKSDAVELLRRECECDIILVDDGFQHWPLVRSLDLVAVDLSAPEQSWHQFPHGGLREPLAALRDADLVLFTNGELDPHRRVHQQITAAIRPDTPRFNVRVRYTGVQTINGSESLSWLAGKRLFLFAGIGNFSAFVSGISTLGGTIAGSHSFPDHVAYASPDLQELAAMARHAGAEVLVTTMKDWVKISPEVLELPCVAVMIEPELTPPMDQLVKTIDQLLSQEQGAGMSA